MSFRAKTHPSYDKYDILWEKYVPTVGKCNENGAEMMRMVGNLYYQVYNSDSFDETNAEKMESLMGEIVEWTWDNLADDSDRKALLSCQPAPRIRTLLTRKREIEKILELGVMSHNRRPSHNLDNNRCYTSYHYLMNRNMQHEFRYRTMAEAVKLKDVYKFVTGKKYRLQSQFKKTPFESLVNMKVMYNGNMTLLADIMTEVINHSPNTISVKSEFVPKISREEFRQYQECQNKCLSGMRGCWLPEFMYIYRDNWDSTKALDIMNHYRELVKYYR